MSIEVRRNYKGNDATSILTVQEFIQLANSSTSVYENIKDLPGKQYYDLDIYAPSTDDYYPDAFLTEVVPILTEFVSHALTEKYKITPIIKACESCGYARKKGELVPKYSLRLYVPNIISRPKTQQILVKNLNAYLQSNTYRTQKHGQKIIDAIKDIIGGDTKDYQFDESVYDPNKKMRCIFSSKDGEDRPLRPMHDTKIEDTIISACFSPNAHLDESIPETVAINSSQSQSPTMNTNNEIAALLSCISVEKRASSGQYQEWVKVMLAVSNSSSIESREQNAAAFANWSIQAPGYEDNYDNAVEMFMRCNPDKEGKKLTIGTLHFMAMQDNKTKYFSLFKNKKRYAQNDAMAAKMVHTDLSDQFKVCEGQMFFKHDNIWTNDPIKIQDEVLHYIQYESNIYAEKMDKDTKVVPAFAQNISKAKNIFDSLMLIVKHDNVDDNLLYKFYTSMKHCLCFKDGILNMKTKNFMLWKDVPPNTYYPIIQIKRNFATHTRNEQNINFIKENILMPMFGEYYDDAIHFLSRAIAGHYEDKRWGTYTGNRNCGKGVFYDLAGNAIGDYLQPFELNNLLCTRQTNSLENVDASKKLYWVIPFQFARLAMSQEVPDNEALFLNSPLLKKLTGGGDTVNCKRNYDRTDTKIIVSATLFILGNYEVKVASDDCNETRLEMSSYVQFTSQEDINSKLSNIRDENGNLFNAAIDEKYINSRYKIKDADIKDKCRTHEMGNAFIDIIMEAYKDHPVHLNKNIVFESNPLVDKINQLFSDELYEFTKNPNDIILASDFETDVKRNSSFQLKKIVEELSAMGIVKKQHTKGDLRKKCVYYGIKYGKNHPIQSSIIE